MPSQKGMLSILYALKLLTFRKPNKNGSVDEGNVANDEAVYNRSYSKGTTWVEFCKDIQTFFAKENGHVFVFLNNKLVGHDIPLGDKMTEHVKFDSKNVQVTSIYLYKVSDMNIWNDSTDDNKLNLLCSVSIMNAIMATTGRNWIANKMVKDQYGVPHPICPLNGKQLGIMHQSYKNVVGQDDQTKQVLDNIPSTDNRPWNLVIVLLKNSWWGQGKWFLVNIHSLHDHFRNIYDRRETTEEPEITICWNDEEYTFPKDVTSSILTGFEPNLKRLNELFRRDIKSDVDLKQLVTDKKLAVNPQDMTPFNRSGRDVVNPVGARMINSLCAMTKILPREGPNKVWQMLTPPK